MYVKIKLDSMYVRDVLSRYCVRIDILRAIHNSIVLYIVVSIVFAS